MDSKENCSSNLEARGQRLQAEDAALESIYGTLHISVDPGCTVTGAGLILAMDKYMAERSEIPDFKTYFTDITPITFNLNSKGFLTSYHFSVPFNLLASLCKQSWHTIRGIQTYLELEEALRKEIREEIELNNIKSNKDAQ